MDRAFPASSFLLAKLAAIKTTTSIVSQLQIFIRHVLFLQLMPAIEANHQTDGLFLSVNLIHLYY
jgi:hypothetical protein